MSNEIGIKFLCGEVCHGTLISNQVIVMFDHQASSQIIMSGGVQCPYSKKYCPFNHFFEERN